MQSQSVSTSRSTTAFVLSFRSKNTFETSTPAITDPNCIRSGETEIPLGLCPSSVARRHSSPPPPRVKPIKTGLNRCPLPSITKHRNRASQSSQPKSTRNCGSANCARMFVTGGGTGRRGWRDRCASGGAMGSHLNIEYLGVETGAGIDSVHLMLGVPIPSRNDAMGLVVLARSACANPSSFARHGPRTCPRLHMRGGVTMDSWP